MLHGIRVTWREPMDQRLVEADDSGQAIITDFLGVTLVGADDAGGRNLWS